MLEASATPIRASIITMGVRRNTVPDVAPDKLAKIQQIEAQGPSVEVGAMRLRLLKETIGARVDQQAEFAILSGCHAPFRFFPIKGFVELLERLGVSYS